MKNSNVTHHKSELTTQTFKNLETLKTSITLAFERTNQPISDVNNMVRDVYSEFSTKDINQITKAIKNGSLGLYGRTYRMSTQEVCIWIREYLKTNKVSVNKFIKNPYSVNKQLK